MKPLSNQVLILPSAKEEKVGSLFLATSAQENENSGVVIAVGPGKTVIDGTAVIAMTVAVGDKVMFQPGAGVDITFEGKAHLLVSEDNILAVL